MASGGNVSSSSQGRPDFVSALMGDPWLEIEWRRAIGGKARALRAGPVGSAGKGGRFAAPLSDRQRIGNALGAPQAVVKVIAGGGVSDRGELTAQLKYLSRDGDLALEEADGDYRGAVETRGDVEEIAAAWADDWADHAAQDGRYARAKSKTFHLLVSFPEGTDRRKAKAAAWSFADRLCHSGDFGDEWRNVRAWHEDRAHPHMHLIIDRRGATGRMMKIHPAAEINPKVLRALQVDVAAEHGIALNDTPRASRGLSRQPASSREWRASERGERRGRSEMRERYAELARAFATDAARREAKAQIELASRLQRSGQTGLADTLREAARRLQAGEELTIMDGEAARDLTPQDLQAMDAETLSKTIAESVREAEELAPQMTDEAARAALEVETGKIRKEFADLLPEDERPERDPEKERRLREVLGYEATIATRDRLGDLQPGQAESLERADEAQASRSESPERGGEDGPARADLWAQVEAADAKVIEAYEAKGMNGERALARIIGGKEAEPETLSYWREEEIKEFARENDVPRSVATREIDRLQALASDTYRDAEREIEQMRGRAPENEIERDTPTDARRSAGLEVEEGASSSPAREGASAEPNRIDLATAREPVSAEALRAQVQRDAAEIAKAQAARDREKGVDRGLDIDFD